MDVRIQNDTSNIDWDLVAEILQKVGMASHSSEIIKKAFEKSYATVFIFDENKLIGFGRAISDESYQAAIYDVAVAPEY